MNKTALFLYILIGILLLSSCCKKELQDPPKEINCGVGFEKVNDSCFCPEGKFILEDSTSSNNECRNLTSNEYYVKLPSSCACYAKDTMVAEFEWTQGKLKLNNSRYSGTSDFLWGAVDSFYTTKTSSFDLINLFREPCIINNVTCAGQLTGVKSNADTIHLKLYFRSLEDWFNAPLDSCDLLLTK